MKIDRAEIERLLSLAEDRPHNHYAMYGEEIIAVCRAWLALDAAPEVDVYEMNDGRIVTDAPGLLNGQRVRLVATSGGDGNA